MIYCGSAKSDLRLLRDFIVIPINYNIIRKVDINGYGL